MTHQQCNAALKRSTERRAQQLAGTAAAVHSAPHIRTQHGTQQGAHSSGTAEQRLTTASEPEASESGDSGVSQPRDGKSDSGLSSSAGSKPAASTEQVGGLAGVEEGCGREGELEGTVRRQPAAGTVHMSSGRRTRACISRCPLRLPLRPAPAQPCPSQHPASATHLLRPDSSSRLMLSAAFS